MLLTKSVNKKNVTNELKYVDFLQDSSIVNQGITDSVKNRRFPISSLFQKPMEFSSPPSGKKTPSSSVKRRSMLRSAKENSSPSPSTDSNKQEEASVAHKRSTFGALPMSTNLRRREIVNPTSRSRYLGSTIASRISQLDSASRPLKDSHPKVNQFRQTKKVWNLVMHGVYLTLWS
jgi:hypothetical protein